MPANASAPTAAILKLAEMTGSSDIFAGADDYDPRFWVIGSVSRVIVRVEDGHVAVDSSRHVVEGPVGATRIRHISRHEVLPTGLTYSEIAEQILAHANRRDWVAIGKCHAY